MVSVPSAVAAAAHSKNKPKKWRSNVSSKQMSTVAQESKPTGNKTRKTATNKEDANAPLNESKASNQRVLRTTTTTKRQPFVNVTVNGVISDSEESQISSEPEKGATAKTIKARKRMSQRASQASTGRDRMPKSYSAASRESGDDLSRFLRVMPNADKASRESSFVTDGGAPSMANDERVPRASSPIPQHALAESKENNMGDNDKDEDDDEEEASLEKSEVNESKQHRGIVAEMHAHERRQARLVGQANKQASNTASRLFEQLRSTSQLSTPVSPEGQPGMLPHTYFPYGFSTVPNTTAVLSPYGLSPYAEPGSSWTTNVYVNNLPPHTTDDDLLRLGSCFGRVKSHKAIINQDTGLCKGYGFIMYEFLHDAELAIQQLPLHGLSTSWAKESFSSKLRRMADSTTSNVYLSNLPQDITPAGLEQLFLPHKVISLRILTDPVTGKGRGVGFVRLRDRTVAQECIQRLNGMTISGQESPLQARYADSEAQKQFKLCARAQLSRSEAEGKESREFDVPTMPMPTPSPPSAETISHTNAITQPAFVAALHGQNAWTGFATPTSNNAGFSPLLGFMSPQAGLSGFPSSASPQLSPMARAYSLDSSSYYPPAGFDPSLLVGSRPSNDALDPVAVHRLQWLAASREARAQFATSAAPSSRTASNQGPPSSAAAKKAFDGQETYANKLHATYLPPELALQHARALMEKNATQAFDVHGGQNDANSTALTQWHVESERADLLKMLKETSEKMARMHTTAAADEQTHSRSGDMLGLSFDDAGTIELSDLPPSSQASQQKSQPETNNHMPRRFTNPGMMLEGTDKVSQAASMRPSLSAAALSPLRFLYSQDPHAPISVEAIDVSSRLNNKEDGNETTQEAEGSSDTHHKQCDDGDTVADKTTFTHDQPNTTIDSGDAAAESSYTSTSTSNNVDDSNASVGSATSMRKSDSGKDFQCRNDFGKDVDGSNEKDNAAANHTSPLILGMMAAAAAKQTCERDGKRNRSKSVVIHVPLEIGSTDEM